VLALPTGLRRSALAALEAGSHVVCPVDDPADVRGLLSLDARADSVLLVPAFPQARRITARLEATRRDRLTSWLPMMRAPHPEGLVGAVRVEMRGRIGGRAETRILGVASPPAAAAAAVTSAAARWAVAGRLTRAGTAGLAELVGEPGAFLAELGAAGITISAFEGAPGE
jgi:hypothetical protein